MVLDQLGCGWGLQLKSTSLHIMSSEPMFAASQGALCSVGSQRRVVEVKCPTTFKTANLYANENGMTPKAPGSGHTFLLCCRTQKQCQNETQADKVWFGADPLPPDKATQSGCT